MKIIAFENGNIDEDTFSGGERIAINLLKRWCEKKEISEVVVYCTDSITKSWARYDIGKIKLIRFLPNLSKSLFLEYGFRCIIGTIKAFFLKLDKSEKYIIYLTSDFWPNLLPSLVIKYRLNGKSFFIGSQYLYPPSPLKGFRGTNVNNYFQIPRFKDIVYFLTNRIGLNIIIKISNYIFITSTPDKILITRKKFSPKKIIIIKGGVDKVILKSRKYKEIENLKYDALFVGRLHPQKGVIELIETWNILINQMNKKYLLIIIGNGELEKQIHQNIIKYNLQSFVLLKGYKDGEEKYQIFTQSKIFIHPAVYDSGGMAAAEAMGFGLPVVGYNLEAFKTYYPKGMLKVEKIGNPYNLADAIIKVLSNPKIYNKLSKEALTLAKKEWLWEDRISPIIDTIQNKLNQTYSV